MDFFDLAKYSFEANFVRIQSCVKPLKPRTRDTGFHRFSFTVFQTVILCDKDYISLKSLISSVTHSHSPGLSREFHIHIVSIHASCTLK